nr:hypothetical protein CFP56_09948 [Quercus suber]
MMLKKGGRSDHNDPRVRGDQIALEQVSLERRWSISARDSLEGSYERADNDRLVFCSSCVSVDVGLMSRLGTVR